MLPQSSADHYRQQQDITALAVADARNLWAGVSVDFELGWSAIAATIFSTTVQAQTAAAASGVRYVSDVLKETGQADDPVAPINPQRFAGGTRDGRPLETLLHGTVYTTKRRVEAGLSVAAALQAGSKFLMTVVQDSIIDADRQAVASSVTVRPRIGGYVRMLNPPSCKFCITLAGKWFRWNQGFQAHVHCDCRHIPASENISGDFTTDPYRYFRALPEQDQDRLFGKNDAQALRDGGDIYRIVNTRSRGLADDALKSTPGRNRGWQSRRWDSPSKMTIDDIYRAAGDNRAKAIRLMEDNGFITGEQTAGGNLIGNSPSAFGDLAAGALGRGGTRVGATTAYRKAIQSGVRDPLEPATQTAAERRLHQAVLAKQAADRGIDPFSTSGRRISPAVRAQVDRQYQRQIADLSGAPDQVRVLARILRVI